MTPGPSALSVATGVPAAGGDPLDDVAVFPPHAVKAPNTQKAHNVRPDIFK
jgi:hypothetical protein